MKRVLYNTMAVVAVALLASACTKSAQDPSTDNTAGTESENFALSTSIIGYAEADLLQNSPTTLTATQQIGVVTKLHTVTRAHSTNSFRASDQIGVFVHSTAFATQGATNHSNNVCYITLDGATWRAKNSLGGPLDTPPYYISAYYPYGQSTVDAHAIIHRVELDQSSPLVAASVELEKSNFLVARGVQLDNATTEPKVTLNFAHAMSLLEVKIHLPEMVEGRQLDFLESIIVRGTETRATVNLASATVTAIAGNIADIKPRRTAGTGKPGVVSVFEAVVVPQNVTSGTTLLEIRCRMKDGSIESFDYTIPKNNWMAFKSGFRTSITLVPTAEASFMGELAGLEDGLAHSDMALPIFVAKDLTWSLSCENIPWMTISATAAGTYGKTLSGKSTTGAATNVYVKVEGNLSQVLPRSGQMVLRAFRSDMSEVAPALYTVVQSYYRFTGVNGTWSAASGEGTQVVASFEGNQAWTATAVDGWVKLGTSSIFGAGNPAVSYSHVGSLGASSLWLQADANNSEAARVTDVNFASDMVGGGAFKYTVSQAAPTMTLVPSSDVRVAKGVGTGANLFTVTAPVGVKWQVLSVTPEAGKDMGLALSVGTGVQMVGTGAQQQVTGSYTASAISTTRYTNVVLGFAAMGVTQQKTIKVTQEAAGPETITVNGTKWTTGNLVADGANGCKVGAPGDGGLYFQYGGLIGYKGGSAGDGTGIVNATTHANGKFWGGAASFSTNDVAVTPAGYTSSKSVWPYYRSIASGGYGYYYFSGYATKYADFQGQANAYSVALGIGDPCAHYLGSSYRMPTYAELSAITGSTVEGSWVAWGSVTGKWVTNGPPASATIGAWFGPNAKTTPNVATDLFFPASGYRNAGSSGGNFYFVGTSGCYWSSSVYDAANSFDLQFGESNGAIPRFWSAREYGLPVRCVAK